MLYLCYVVHIKIWNVCYSKHKVSHAFLSQSELITAKDPSWNHQHRINFFYIMLSCSLYFKVRLRGESTFRNKFVVVSSLQPSLNLSDSSTLSEGLVWHEVGFGSTCQTCNEACLYPSYNIMNFLFVFCQSSVFLHLLSRTSAWTITRSSTWLETVRRTSSSWPSTAAMWVHHPAVQLLHLSVKPEFMICSWC